MERRFLDSAGIDRDIYLSIRLSSAPDPHRNGVSPTLHTTIEHAPETYLLGTSQPQHL